ncbi:MAG: hypothetical protein HGA19_18525 [Oscillochloris sp.]|nr:hypothetical protein [Oscillochloris sp.]
MSSPVLRCQSAYGLRIRSELALPELGPAFAADAADVTIRFGIIDRPLLEVAPDSNGAFQPAPGEVYFFYPVAGKFLVRDGCEVVLEPIPDADPANLRFLILGVTMGIVLHQRGVLALHASAVVVDQGVVAFLGHSGEGKSTLAARMLRRGHTLLTDDILALDLGGAGLPHAWPGFPQLKLWPDTLRDLGDDPEALPQLLSVSTKRAYRVSFGFALQPLRLRRIYVLGGGREIATTPLVPQHAFQALVGNTYALRFIGASGSTSVHLHQCAQMIRSLPIVRLQRPYRLADLNTVAALIEHEVGAETDYVCESL